MKMIDPTRIRPPASIAIAATALVGQTLVLFVERPDVLQAISVCVAGFFAALLLRHSRLAWAIALIGAIGQIVTAIFGAGLDLLLLANVALLICLLLPSALEYVWSKGDRWLPQKLDATWLSDKIINLPHRLLSVAAGWEDDLGQNEADSKRRYGVLLWRVGVFTLFLLLLLGATSLWQQSNNQDGSINTVILDVIWTFYAVAQVTFLVILGVVVARYFGVKNEVEGPLGQSRKLKKPGKPPSI